MGKIAAWIAPSFQVLPPVDPSTISRNPEQVGDHTLINGMVHTTKIFKRCVKPLLNDQTFFSIIVFVARNMGWINDQTFACEAKCWMKMFDQDEKWETIYMQCREIPEVAEL